MKHQHSVQQLNLLYSNQAMLLSEASRIYFVRKTGLLKPKTIMLYTDALHLLTKFLDNPPIASITQHLIESWRTDLLAERTLYEGHPNRPEKVGYLSIATVRKHLGHARTMFKWASASAEIPQLNHNPFMGVQFPTLPPQQPKAIHPDDIRSLIHSVESADYSAGYNNKTARALLARNVAIIHFLRSTGCRIEGATTLKLGNVKINATDGHAIVSEKARGAKKDRAVPMDEECCLAFLEWLDLHPSNIGRNQYAFVGLHGKTFSKQLKSRAVSSMLHRAAKRVELNDRHNPHSFRHRAITRWVEQLGVVKASKLAGHTDIKTTEKFYARFTINHILADLREAKETY